MANKRKRKKKKQEDTVAHKRQRSQPALAKQTNLGVLQRAIDNPLAASAGDILALQRPRQKWLLMDHLVEVLSFRVKLIRERCPLVPQVILREKLALL